MISSRALRYTATMHAGSFVVYSLTFRQHDGQKQQFEGLWFPKFHRFGIAMSDDISVWLPADDPESVVNDIYVAPLTFP